MRNGFNQFNVPYMNELTANQLGAASSFGGNMPLGYINWSLGAIANFFAPQDQRPRITDPREWERIIRGGQQPGGVLNPAGQIPQTPPIAGGCPPGEVEYYDILGIRRCGKREIQGGRGDEAPVTGPSGPQGILGKVFGYGSVEEFFGSDLAKDLGKRFGLTILGALLLLMAIYLLAR